MEEKLSALQSNGTSFLREKVSSEDIAEIIAKWTGIPTTKLLETEKEILLHLEDELRKQVIGQEPALSAISSAIRRSKSGLAEAGKPMGSFLFL